MEISKQIALLKLDDYKNRTGDYSATKIPEFRDFVAPIVVNQVEKRERKMWPPATIAKYGLNRWQYWALLDKQNGRCAICGELPNGRALHLDHCHNSNKVRALICHGCNIAIGMIKEDAETARAIANYLEKHSL